MQLKNGIVYNITVTEEVLLVTEEGGLSRRKCFLSRRTRLVFFVYRLVLDAKPDRGML